MPPRTYNTKPNYRGTAWLAANEGVSPTPPSSGKSKRRSAPLDPDFAFPDDESQQAAGVRSNIPLSPRRLDQGQQKVKAPSNTNADKDEASGTTNHSDDQEEMRTKVQALETEVEELKQLLETRQNAMESALEEKDTQIKEMAQNLDGVTKERDSMKERLTKAEACLTNVGKEKEQLQNDLAEQKDATESFARDTESRFSELEQKMHDSRQVVETVVAERERLVKAPKEQNKTMSSLTDRLGESEMLIQKLQTNLEQQTQQATQERQDFQIRLESMESMVTEKNDRIHKLEDYIQQSAREAKQLKTLLTQLNQKFSSKRAGKKRRVSEPDARSNGNDTLRLKTQKSDRSYTGWLADFER